METQTITDTQEDPSRLATWIQYTKELVIILSEDYKIVEFNPIAEQIYGWERKEVLNKSFITLSEKSGMEHPLPKNKIDLSAGKKFQTEITLQNKQNQKFTLAWTIASIKPSHSSKSKQEFLLIAQNISLQREAETALKKSEEFLYTTHQELVAFTELVTGHDQKEKSLIDYAKNIYSYLEGIIAAVPGCVYWMNREGVYLGCNDTMAVLYNLKSRKDIIGKTYEDIYNKKTGDGYRKADTQVMTTGEPLEVAETRYNSDGTIRVYKSNKVALRDKFGVVIGMLGNSIDITEQIQIEQAVKEAKRRADAANLAKSEFLAVMSHEFRIPLTSILGMTKLLTMQKLSPDKQHEYLQNISSAGMHLLNLINDTLDFAKLEAGKFELSPAPMNLNALIEETCTMLTPLANAKNLELLVHVDQSIPFQFVGDKRALRQIIINLVGNGIKFTAKGFVSIQVECLEKTAHSVKLIISVSDSGIGIPEEKQGMIFNHFSQVDASHSRRYGGTGLGLTITKQLIDLMSGTIGVSSQEGKGTTFRCVLDFALQENESNLISPWTTYQSTTRILIVDDTPRGEVMRKHLSFTNCEVVSANEAFNAILASYQLSDPYKIIIVSQKLNNIDPLELGRSVSMHDELRQSMLILVPEEGSVKTKKAATAAGFFECIVKATQPVAFQVALTAAWEKWIEQLEINVKPPTIPTISSQINLKAQSKESNKLKILLVEDDAIVEIIHKNYLESLVETLHIARNGHEALEKLNDHYDLVFMDMGLPDISGKDVIIKIRKKMKNKHIPIVSLTGYGSESNKQEFLNAGADEVMIKPVFIDQLKEIIEKYCNKDNQ